MLSACALEPLCSLSASAAGAALSCRREGNRKSGKSRFTLTRGGSGLTGIFPFRSWQKHVFSLDFGGFPFCTWTVGNPRNLLLFSDLGLWGIYEVRRVCPSLVQTRLSFYFHFKMCFSSTPGRTATECWWFCPVGFWFDWTQWKSEDIQNLLQWRDICFKKHPYKTSSANTNNGYNHNL